MEGNLHQKVVKLISYPARERAREQAKMVQTSGRGSL